MNLADVQQYQAAVDYVTLVSHNERGAALLDRIGWRMVEEQEEAGGIIKAMLRGGYDGYQLNGVFYGRRYDGAMLMVSGPRALSACLEVDWGDVHATRIDLQVTAWLENYEMMLGRVAYDEAKAFRKDNPKIQTAYPIYIDGAEKGSTLLMGSRSSPKYGRLYDKWAESGEDEYYAAWRFECEYKADAASAIVQTLVSGGWAADVVTSIVKGQWEAWGIALDQMPACAIVPPTLTRSKTDVERKMLWLKTQVQPTVKDLRGRVKLGELLTALGLTLEDIC